MPVSFRVVISGPQKTKTTLSQFGHALDSLTQKLPLETAEAIRERASAYDAPPVSTYQRTGALAESWYAEPSGAGGSLVGSRSPYAGYVRGTLDGGPAYMHAGRWESWPDIVEGIAGPGALRERLLERIAALKAQLFTR